MVGDMTSARSMKSNCLGKHNWQNVCAAVTAVWQVTQNTGAMRSVLTSFSGMEHRLELVRELDGVRYYNDSFGTTPETAIVAIQAFEEPKVVILGGSDKGADYGELAKVVAGANIRKVLLIGEQAGRIGKALKAAGVNDIMPRRQNHRRNSVHRPRPSPSRAMWFCSRPPAPALICSRITRTAASSSSKPPSGSDNVFKQCADG